MQTTLLLLDIQKDYFPGGKMELVGAEAAARQAYALLQCFRERGGRHIHIQHLSPPGANFLIPGERGADIHDLAAHFEGEPILYKHSPNAFHQTDLLATLREWGTERLILCGMMTHLSVDSTLRAAHALGFSALIAADACATRALTFGGVHIPAGQVQAASLAAFESFGKVKTVEQIFSLLAAEEVSALAKEKK
jgi:nicotinamidase-related amidase